MWSDAYAQFGGSASSSNPTVSTLLMLLQFVPIFVIVYFLMIRPQRQQQKQMERMRKDLKKGDRVLTTGGMFGTVVGIDGTKTVLRIAEDIKVEFTTSSIVQVLAGDAK